MNSEPLHTPEKEIDRMGAANVFPEMQAQPASAGEEIPVLDVGPYHGRCVHGVVRQGKLLTPAVEGRVRTLLSAGEGLRYPIRRLGGKEVVRT